jgi:putative transposase
MVYHVLNRANARMEIFEDDGDYLAFFRILAEARERVDMRVLAWCVMPTHWHRVLWPRQNEKGVRNLCS